MSSGPGQPPPPPQQPPPPGQAGGAYPPPAGAGTPPGAPGPPPGAPPGVPGPYEHKTPWTAYIKPTIWTLVAIYVIAFVFLNAEIVAINFIFFKAEVALIFVLVGVALIGAGLCAGVMMMTRRRSTKKAQLAAAQAQLASGKK